MAIIYGTDENEVFKGYKGDNQYQGNGGYDTYRDYDGNEVYYYNQGDGTDTIQDSVGTDKIVFGDGITFNDLSFEAYGNNLHVNLASGEMINIVDWIRREASQIESFEFSDGSSITNEDVNNILNGTYNPDDGSNDDNNGDESGDDNNGSTQTPAPTPIPDPNIIYGTDENEVFKGYKGDNQYQGNGGSDTYRDYDGNEVYYYNQGDGTDTIQDSVGTDKIVFGEGISFDDLSFEAYGNNLHVNLASGEMINIVDWIRREASQIESFEFSDGSSVTNEDVNNILNGTYNPIGDTPGDTPAYEVPIPTYIGTDNYDYIDHQSGDNIYYAKKESDWIRDYDGNDAYIFSKGDVQDTYKDFGGTDELIFTGGITKDDLLFFRYNNDIHICVEYSTDKVDISKGMESYYGIEKIQFEDGSSLSRDEYLSLISDTPVIIGNSDSSVDYGVEDDEVLYGIQGDDTIYSYSGDDLIYAGSGDDVVFAGDGNDDIQGNTGNDILYGGLGDDVYCGYYDYQNMGRDLLFDEGGNDMLYLEDYLSSETSFNAYDSNGDNNLDALKLNLKNDTVVIIEEYFNNASSKIEESIAGMGYIENIAFQNTEVNLSNLQTYLT